MCIRDSGECGQRRPRQGQRHEQEDAPFLDPLDARGVEQIGRHHRKALPHEEDTQRVEKRRHDERHPGVGELEVARVEGVKEWRIFLFVALPLARPTLAALAIILFLASWNNYLWPLLINSQPGSMTAPVALGTLIGLTKVSWGGIMAGSMMLTAPMLVVFVLLQRHFIAGIAAGAIK